MGSWHSGTTSTSCLGVLTIAAIWLLAVSPARAAMLPSGFSERVIAQGLDAPTSVDWAPDGRMFVAEQAGLVRVLDADGALLPDPLLDIRDEVNDFGDRGLVGLAVDSDFSTNGYLYLLYARELDPLNPDSGAEMASRLTRVSVKPDNTLENEGDPETVILGTQSDQPCPTPDDDAVDCIPAFKYHVVGTVRSDPGDGTLWVGSGNSHENNIVDEPAYRPQDDASYAGKILHVDRDGHGLPGHPFCPADDELTHVCTKIYAKGFRNPFRFTLRPGKGPVVGDVGNADSEEVDLVKEGRNYGWPCYEGPVRYALFEYEAGCQSVYANEGTPDEAAPPAWSYDHSAGCSAVIGGPVYEGDAYPASYSGKLFVGDWCQGWIKLLTLAGGGEVTEVEEFATDVRPVDLALTPEGRLAYVDIDGAVRQFKGPPADTRTPDRPPNPGPAAEPATSDSTPPEVELFAKRGRQAGRRIRIDASCDEACSVTAKGRVVLSKRPSERSADAAAASKSFRLEKATAALAAGRTGTLRLVPRVERASRRIARRVRRGDKARLDVVVRVADSLGNAARRRMTIKLHGR